MKRMIRRLEVLDAMKKANLEMIHVKDFSIPTLLKACEQIELNELKKYIAGMTSLVQKALIEAPEFMNIYARLIKAAVPSFNVNNWIAMLLQLGQPITTFTFNEIMEAKTLVLPTSMAEYEFLRFFGKEVSPENKEQCASNICTFYQQRKVLISDLKEPQRRLLVGNQIWDLLSITGDSIGRMLDILAENKVLLDVLNEVALKKIELLITIQDLENLRGLNVKDAEKIRKVYKTFNNDPECIGLFWMRWLENNAPRFDLDWFCDHSSLVETKRNDLLKTRIGYVSGIYQSKLQDIPYDRLEEQQVRLLIFAVSQRKKHFLEMVSKHFDIFMSVEKGSMLYDPEFYKRCNLNTLTIKDLQEINSEPFKHSHLDCLLQNREYTVKELKLLYYAGEQYIKLYNLLNIKRVDDRMIVMRQLLKGKLIDPWMETDQLSFVAQYLSEKPLDVWMQQELRHIPQLTKKEGIAILCVLSKIKQFLADIESHEEMMFVVRNAERIKEYHTWQEVKDQIVELDEDWKQLQENLDLSDEFLQKNKKHILKFLFKNGAGMTLTYSNYLTLTQPQSEAFPRIVRAELMGKFYQLKYFKGDLEKEIDLPITVQQQKCWQKNTMVKQNEWEVVEADDYYATLQIGVVPYRTCLSYVDGSYRDCLLSCFDSNKKFLFVKKNGKLVGRAMIRLTKGSLGRPKKSALEFVDLQNGVESGQDQEPQACENLALFLEMPYLIHLNTEDMKKAKCLLVECISKKAACLQALPILNLDYVGCYRKGLYVSTKYYLFISRSKAGAQYLDSLYGEVTVDKEASYKQNNFLIAQECLSKWE